MSKDEERELLNTLRSIDITLKSIEQMFEALKAHMVSEVKKHKFIPEMSENEGNVYPITGEPKENSSMCGKKIVPKGKMTAYP